MRAIAFAFVAMILTGCAAQRMAERQREFAEATRACELRYPHVVGGMVAHAACVNEAGARLDGGGAANALIRATRMSLSEQVDRREITMAEATARFARVVYETSQDTQRADASRAANNAAILSILAARQPAITYTPISVPFRRTTTCTPMSSGAYSCTGN